MVVRGARIPAAALPLAACVLLGAGCAAEAGGARPAPVLDARTHRTEYLGPGREAPVPEGLAEIRLAQFGPAEESDPEWGEARRGAVMALEEANAAGGCGGLPVRLLNAWSENPWGTGVAALAKLVYREDVCAIIGGVDGATTHLAEQIVVKARLPLVSPGGTDPSVNFTNVAWMFTLPPTDDHIAPALADVVVGSLAGGAWCAVTTTDRDAHAAWRAFRAAFVQHRVPAPLLHIAAPAAAREREAAVEEVAASGARTVVVFAGARDAAGIVKALRAGGFAGLIAGGAPLGRRPFLEEAGGAAEGIVFPLLFDPAEPSACTFVRAYEARWGGAPDFLAAYSYDAVRMTLEAVRRAGPNRARLRDALAAPESWTGVTGSVAWDATGRNVRPFVMGVWRDGKAARR